MSLFYWPSTCTLLCHKTSRDNSLQFIVKMPIVNAIWQPDFPSKLSLPQTGSMGKRFIKAVTPPLQVLSTGPAIHSYFQLINGQDLRCYDRLTSAGGPTIPANMLRFNILHSPYPMVKQHFASINILCYRLNSQPQFSIYYCMDNS